MANNIFKRREITLDTFNDLNKEMIASFSQGDRISDKLIIQLTNDTDGPLDLTDAVQVRIDFRKPDGKLVFQYCNIEDRPNALISAVLTTQTLASPGKVYAEVTVKYPEGKDAVTRQFTFWVQDAIASDKSIESQNEWPMLERAIVAGDMLAGVDLVAIIQAGELAKGALPKAGGTMTGNRVMDRKLATNSIYDQFVTGSTSNYFVGVSAAGKYHLYDDIAKITPFEYDPVAKSFNVLSATNVVKKAGDTMTGNLNFAAASQIQNLAATGQLVFGNSGIWINDTNGNFVPWQYRYSDKQFIVNADTNLMKTTGGSFSGPVSYDAAPTIRGAASTWDMRPFLAGVYSKGFRHTINTGNNYYAVAPIDETGAANWANQMALYGATGVFDVKDLNIRGGSASNVVTKLKDGQFNLSLTSDATNANAGYTPIADRRGNTVTVRMEVTRNAGATNTLICTLPADLRPANTLSYNFLANDGSIVGVNIKWDGSIDMFTAGKTVKIIATYVVN